MTRMMTKSLLALGALALALSLYYNYRAYRQPPPLPASAPPTPTLQLDVDTIDFSGTAFDLQQPLIDDSALRHLQQTAPLEWTTTPPTQKPETNHPPANAP